MKAASLLAVALLAFPGWGLECSHPVLLPGEAVEVWLPAGEGPPELTFCGEPFPVSWTSQPQGDKVLWQAHLPDHLPPGVWLVQHHSQCGSFFRAPPGWAVAELVGLEGASLTAPGLLVLSRPGGVEVTGPAGDWKLSYQFPGQETRELAVSLAPGERRQFTLGYVDLHPSTPVALPGHAFLLRADIFSPVDLPSTAAALVLPPGWGAQPAPCDGCPPAGLEPIPAGVPTARAWLVQVPPGALGTYSLALELAGMGLRGEVAVEVATTLPVEVVVGHWDVRRDRLDLTLPPSIEYEQLLWATTFVGRELPFSGRVLTRGDLERLAQLWQQAD